jgi:hypothetical protein
MMNQQRKSDDFIPDVERQFKRVKEKQGKN